MKKYLKARAHLAHAHQLLIEKHKDNLGFGTITEINRSLPDEALPLIMQQSSLHDLYKARGVSQRWRSLSSEIINISLKRLEKELIDHHKGAPRDEDQDAPRDEDQDAPRDIIASDCIRLLSQMCENRLLYTEAQCYNRFRGVWKKTSKYFATEPDPLTALYLVKRMVVNHPTPYSIRHVRDLHHYLYHNLPSYKQGYVFEDMLSIPEIRILISMMDEHKDSMGTQKLHGYLSLIHI